jgi:hypothetical protein
MAEKRVSTMVKNGNPVIPLGELNDRLLEIIDLANGVNLALCALPSVGEEEDAWLALARVGAASIAEKATAILPDMHGKGEKI